MGGAPGDVFEFGTFRLETAERRLLAGGVAVHLTPKTFDILCLLVREHGHLVTKQRLMDDVWPETFVSDAALTRSIADLRRALGESAGERRYIDTVAKQGYRFVAPVRGEAPVDTPEPPWQDGQASAPAAAPAVFTPATPAHARRATALTAGLIVATTIVVGLLVWRTSGPLPESREAAVRSVAVLPMTGLDVGGADEYLGLGITDALITRLSGLRRITVRPMTAVRAFVAPHADVLAAGRALAVDAVLEGSLQREASRVRVTVRLLRVDTGAPLWAATFDERLDDLFAIEDAISARVAEALVVNVLADERRRLARRDTDNAEAHRAYLEGRYFMGKRMRDDLSKAVALLQRAVQLDPRYALAHAGLADALVLWALWTSPAEAIPQAKAAAQTALALDPSMAEASTVLALIAMNYEWDWAEAGRRYRQAIDANPGYPTAHHWYGEYLAWMGRFDEGLAEVRRAETLDPLSLAIKTDVGKVLYISRRLDEAAAQFQRTLELDRNYMPAWLWLIGMHVYRGRLEEAASMLNDTRVDQHDPGVMMSWAELYMRQGRTSELTQLRDRMVAMGARSYVPPMHLARVHFLAGDRNRGFAEMSRMLDERAPGVICLERDVAFDAVRDDPRFTALLRRAGFER